MTTYIYGKDALLLEDTQKDTVRSVYTYGQTDAANSHLPTEYIEYTKDEDGEEAVTAHERYTYDPYGNLILLVDLLTQTTTRCAYYTGAGDQAKGAVKSEKQYAFEEESNPEETLLSETTTEFDYQPDETKKNVHDPLRCIAVGKVSLLLWDLFT